jgi:nitrogenase molybdenum-iron protein NifN
VVPVNTPDYSGCLESGFALAVEAIIDTLVPTPRARAGRTAPRQVNVLASSMLTPGDIEAIKEWIEAFGLQPVVLPDLGDSLDGHLIDQDTYAADARRDADRRSRDARRSAATLVIGRSLQRRPIC